MLTASQARESSCGSQLSGTEHTGKAHFSFLQLRMKLPHKKGAGIEGEPQSSFGQSNCEPKSEVITQAKTVAGSAWNGGSAHPVGPRQGLSRRLELLAPGEGDVCRES